MRAAFITRTGSPDAIRVGELPVPAAGPADVLVKVNTVAVNQVDTISLATAAELADAARGINRRLAGPGFAVQVAETLPLGETASAHALVESGQAHGRVVVTVRA